MCRDIPARKAESRAQIHSSRIVANIRHSEASNQPSEIATKRTGGSQTNTLKVINRKNDTLSHSHHFNISNQSSESIRGKMTRELI